MYKWQTSEKSEYDLLKENAKVNRCKMTEAESVFWLVAKNSGLGAKCRRQHIIGGYIVDFIFLSKKLIIEIDGGYHFTEEQRHEDQIRQQYLEDNGYTILRFSNEQVLSDIDSVSSIVKTKLLTL